MRRKIVITVCLIVGTIAIYYVFNWDVKRPRFKAAMQTVKEIETSKVEAKSNVNALNKKYPDENLLSKEKSPYLLQHANNPVHWYPWGDEAFAKAKAEDKPVFLSIGYSTCHWCHVMEHESFENPEIAEVMNKYFVSIKVDREERPDVDNIYMKAVMSLTGSGGWPLTVFVTADRKPFYGGTYFPPDSQWGRPGFKELLLSMNDAWQNKRDELVKSSNSITQNLQSKSFWGQIAGNPMPDEGTLRNAYGQYVQRIGVTRVTVARHLQQLKNLKFISSQDRQITILDKEGLQKALL